MDTLRQFYLNKARRILSLVILVSLLGLFLPLLVVHAACTPGLQVTDGLGNWATCPATGITPAMGSSGAAAGSTAAGVGLGAAGKATPSTIAAKYCTATNEGVPCWSESFFGMFTVQGICAGPQTCKAIGVTPVTGIGLGIVSGLSLQAISKMLSGGGTGSSGSSLSPYSTTNPYGTAGCTGTRYISPVQTNDPCGVYIPTTSTTNPNINLNPIGGGTQTT